MITTSILLTITFISIWVPPGPVRWKKYEFRPWHFLACFTLSSATINGSVNLVGALLILLFTGACVGLQRSSLHMAWRVLSAVVIFALSVGFFLHKLPGFHRHLVVEGIQLGPDALPFTRYLSFDKACVGILLCGLTLTRVKTLALWRTALRHTLILGAVAIPILMGMSVLLGFVRFDPKWTPLFWLFVWSNLFLTCIAEEAFFRGFIQRGLVRFFSRYRHGKWIGLMIAALLFGIGHLPGGWAYVLIATVAGLAYGWAYQRDGNIEAAILLHFGVNTVHFLLFTYPALA